jgi:prepilin-type N-terminal cleavage/methylation domain-containing protein
MKARRLPRNGFTILEVLLAIVILSIGGISALQVMQSARGLLGQSQEELRLQVLATQVFEEARARTAGGEYTDLGALEERTVAAQEGESRAVATILRHPGSGGIAVDVEARSPTRRFAFRAALADPVVSFLGSPRPEDRDAAFLDPFSRGAHR